MTGETQIWHRDKKESGHATVVRAWNVSSQEAETGDYGKLKDQPGLNIKTISLMVMTVTMMMKVKSAPPGRKPRDLMISDRNWVPK